MQKELQYLIFQTAILWRSWPADTTEEEGKSPGEGIEGPLSQRLINGDSISSGH